MSLLAFNFLTTMSFSCFAQEPDYKVVDRPDNSVIVRNTSEFYRIDKKINVFVGAHAYSKVSGSELGLEYYLDRNKAVQLELFTGRAVFADTINEIFGDKSRTEASGVILSYKHYTGNSFFIRGGIDYKQHDYYRLERDFFDKTVIGETSFAAESVGLIVSIGNQWQIENLTLGFDWIGFSAPIYTRLGTIKNTFAESDYHTKYFKDDQNTYVKKTSAFAMARIGISF